jgi:hypothetical protein
MIRTCNSSSFMLIVFVLLLSDQQSLWKWQPGASSMQWLASWLLFFFFFHFEFNSSLFSCIVTLITILFFLTVDPEAYETHKVIELELTIFVHKIFPLIKLSKIMILKHVLSHKCKCSCSNSSGSNFFHVF